MIVSRRYGFAFVHIPKCAGTSVRVQLAPYDDCGGAFSGVQRHPLFTRNQLIHLTAAQLAEHFPDIYTELLSLEVYAVTRDPAERFRSAVSQHLRAVYRQRLSETPEEMLQATTEDILSALSEAESSGRLSDRYVHFNRQADYVFNGEERLVEHLYRIEDLGEMFEEIGRRIGVRLQPQARMNQNLTFRFRGIEGTLWKANEFLSRHLPSGIYRATKRLATPMVARREIASEKARFLNTPSIAAFVERYYARDFELYKSARRTTG